MKRILFSIVLGAMPVAAIGAPLSEDLRDYVVAFDVEALDQDAKATLRAIINDPNASHGDKVLDVHTVLSQHDALRHVDIHGESLTDPTTMQFGMASFD